MTKDDPRGLIREAFNIEGITLAECRSIFLDWSLDRDVTDPLEAAQRLYETRKTDHPDHPMTQVLSEAAPATPGRRGGRAARMKSDR